MLNRLHKNIYAFWFVGIEMIISEIMFCCLLNLYGFEYFVIDGLLVSLYPGKKYLVWKFPVWNTEGTYIVVVVHTCNIWLCTYHGKHIIAHVNSLTPQYPLKCQWLSWMKPLFLTGAKAILRHFRKLTFMLSLKITDSDYTRQISFCYAPYIIILTAGVLYLYRAVKPEVHWTVLVLWIWTAPHPVP